MSPLLPDPLSILIALWRLLATGALTAHVGASLESIGIGFAVSAGLGIGMALILTRYPRLAPPVMYLADLLRPVSALALFPVIIIGLGIGLLARSFVIFWTAWPPVLIFTLHALGGIAAEIIDAANIDGSVRWHQIEHIRFPLALPGILAGLRVSVSAAWISLTAAEMLGASSGLGYSVLQYAQSFHYADMYAVIVVIALLGFGMAAVFNQLYALSERMILE